MGEFVPDREIGHVLAPIGIEPDESLLWVGKTV